MPVAESKRHLSEPQASGAGGLAFVAVTALLKYLLENGLARRGVSSQIGGDATVSALPPDRVLGAGDEKAQLNLFLYSVTPHALLRLDGDPQQRAPLAFDLHYVITAHGAQDYQAELLLGHAVQILSETPVLDHGAVRDLLAALTSKADRRVVPAPLVALGSSDVASQLGRVQIMPHFLPSEELSRLWSAMQAKLRLAATYKVAAVPVVGSTRR